MVDHAQNISHGTVVSAITLDKALQEKIQATLEKITGNKDFVYEISCDQMCGTGHYSMKGLVIVETQEEYNTWLAGKKPQYVTVREQQKAPAPAPAAAETTAKPIAILSK